MYEHFDVLIIGAGISGVDSAVHLKRALPHKRFAVLEARDAIGGTWDLFRYPGVRSDSDMYTLGFEFKPWRREKAIADGWTIKEYVEEAARENGIEEHIRFGHKVVRAEWDTPTARWTVEVELVHTGDRLKLTAGFIHACSGYYRYEDGYTPEFPGVEDFQGTLIHPQHWPEDLDYTGKRVVVIGSGATAMTLVPAMTDRAEHVTMLQRSPTYVASLPAVDPLAHLMRRFLPDTVAYGATRLKQFALTVGSYQLIRRFPNQARSLLQGAIAKQLGADYVAAHFTPRYNPWDERLCLVPDGDLFKALRSGKADVVTDHIERITERGILLQSGRELAADIIVTATGLVIQALGGATVAVDGVEIDFASEVTYKGLMFSGVPNFAVTFGYVNASWTLKADLISNYICRTLRYMDAHGHDYVVPSAPPAGEPLVPFLDGLTSGYVQRGMKVMPKQGSRWPWRANQNYLLDIRLLRFGPVDDAVTFGSATTEVAEAGELVTA
jgi:cation diffusion facilitator CzcD-associated flavoprotein CzcO